MQPPNHARARASLAVAEHLPAWFTDADAERVEWLNKVLAQIWPSVDAAVHDLVLGIVQPILDRFKPKNFAKLDIVTLSLGTIAPRITSARAHGEVTASGAAIDLEIKWASNVEVKFEVGVRGMPLTLELADLQARRRRRSCVCVCVRARLRVRLAFLSVRPFVRLSVCLSICQFATLSIVCVCVRGRPAFYDVVTADGPFKKTISTARHRAPTAAARSRFSSPRRCASRSRRSCPSCRASRRS